ncbi:MAG TPA: CBS domain-containing protein [Pyrinomonadaceae bacterium]|nr:CBS domain-containing protein [Pyrinomonadaceae bacterium]
MKLRERPITLPELILIAGTRAAIGLGVGLLVKDRLNKDQRRGAGLALVILGGLSTIPLALELFSDKRAKLEEGNDEKETEMKCSEVMTKDPACCLTTDTAFDAAQLMKSEDVGPIPIVSDKQTRKLEGIVTDRDLALKVVAEGLDPKNTKIEEVMTTGVNTCRSDDDLNDAVHLMEANHVRRIPIVDENDRLVGIIAQADIATRVEKPNKTAEVVEAISQAA